MASYRNQLRSSKISCQTFLYPQIIFLNNLNEFSRCSKPKNNYDHKMRLMFINSDVDELPVYECIRRRRASCIRLYKI